VVQYVRGRTLIDGGIFNNEKCAFLTKEKLENSGKFSKHMKCVGECCLAGGGDGVAPNGVSPVL